MNTFRLDAFSLMTGAKLKENSPAHLRLMMILIFEHTFNNDNM